MSSKPTPQFAVPGVNTLRNELASELDRVREFMQEEKRKSAQRDAVLASVVESQQRGYNHHPSSSNYSSSPSSHQQSAAARYTAGGGVGGGGGGVISSSSSPTRLLNGNLAPAPVPTSNYSPSANSAPSAMRHASDNMMTTYPKPILIHDDRVSKPNSARGGNNNNNRPSTGGGGHNNNPNIVGYNFAEENKSAKVMETDIGQAIHGGGFEEKDAARVACSRCGRFFAVHCVDAHEDVCVSKPKGIHRR